MDHDEFVDFTLVFEGGMADRHLLEATSGAGVISSLSHLIRSAIWVAANRDHGANPNPNALSRIGLYMTPLAAGCVKVKIRVKTSLIPLTDAQIDVAFEIDRKTILQAAQYIRGGLQHLLKPKKGAPLVDRIEPTLSMPKDRSDREHSLILHAESAYAGIAAPLGAGANQLSLSVSPIGGTPIALVGLDVNGKNELLEEYEEEEDSEIIGVVRRFNIGSRKGTLDTLEERFFRGERSTRKLRFEVKASGSQKREDNRRLSVLISKNLADNSELVSESGHALSARPASFTVRRILSRGGILKRVRIVGVKGMN